MRKRAAEQMIAEVEAFLAGHVGEVVVGLDVARESWVPLNWIAHAAPTELLDEACRPRHREPPWGSWPWAVDTVLRELMNASGAVPEIIEELQRACLIPYELTLMCPSATPATPFEVVADTVSSIRSFPIDEPGSR